MSKPLLQRNTRFLLVWLPVILLICGLLFYVMLLMQAHHMQEKQLLLKQTNVWTAFKEKAGNIDRRILGEYHIVEADGNTTIPHNIRDTAIYNPDRKKETPFEMLTGQFQWNGKPYNITTYVSSVEISHLIIKVFITEAFILLLLLLAIVVLNRISSRLLWKPFFATLKQVNEYDITRNQPLELPAETGTTEFNELNKEVNILVKNVNTAYYGQKQFVENASHEMQTPLAIIRSKLELLIDQPGITENIASMLEDITDANNRLSQMNRTLLLLSKIENNQFPETETIDLSGLLNQTIENFQRHYDSFPALTTHIDNRVVVQANRSLIEILVSNLLNNSIIHNIPGGQINIELTIDHLLISNTGNPPETAPEELFERFKKGSHQTKTTGLGLALVKQVCLLYHYRITYQYQDGWHELKVTFR